jgi:SpoVK/Ycf46/Vps4 family AAA+-type ATPase
MLRGIRRPPRTFLLHGPPGTGKTLLVEAMAAAAGAALLCASPSAVLSKWSGESERAVRLLFRAARTLASAGGGGGNGGGGCIVFLDEVDALGASRGGGGGGGGGGDNQDALARRVLTELLVQMSRLDAEEEEGEAAGAEAEQSHGGPVWVFAATNRPEDVDPALLRRFERRLAVPLPDAEGRAAFVRAALEEVGEQGEGGEGEAPPLSEADVQRLVAVTAGLSGSDVRAVARRAALAPVRELAEQVRRRRGEAEEEEGEGKRQRRESGGGDGGDGALRLRAVRASDWEEAVAALFQR